MVAIRQPDPEMATGIDITELTPGEAQLRIDIITRATLDMSGEEFVRRYRSGEIEELDNLDVIRAAMLLPLLAV